MQKLYHQIKRRKDHFLQLKTESYLLVYVGSPLNFPGSLRFCSFFMSLFAAICFSEKDISTAGQYPGYFMYQRTIEHEDATTKGR